MTREARITIRLTDAERAAIEKAAAVDNRSLSSFVTIAAYEKARKLTARTSNKARKA